MKKILLSLGEYGRWLANMQINKKFYHLGTFKNEIDAAKAYNDFALKNSKEFSLLNNI